MTSFLPVMRSCGMCLLRSWFSQSLLNCDVDLFTSIIVLYRCFAWFFLGGGCREICVINRGEARVIALLGGPQGSGRVWKEHFCSMLPGACCRCLMPLATIVGVVHHVLRLSVRPSVLQLSFVVLCPSLSTISRDAIAPFLVEEFKWNFSPIFITSVGIAEKFLKVMFQRVITCSIFAAPCVRLLV